MDNPDLNPLFERAVGSAITSGELSSEDLAKYRLYLATMAVSDACKDDMIHAVHRIVQNFVDRAFNDDPVQHSGHFEDDSRTGDRLDGYSVSDIEDKSSVNRVDADMEGSNIHKPEITTKRKRRKT